MAPKWHHDGVMQLEPYVEAIQRQLVAVAGTGGDEARALAAQLAGALESAVRLALQDALAAAASEITCDLAPGSVELRLRGRDPEFVVVRPANDSPERADQGRVHASIALAADEGETARINLRVPERLKMRIEAAATAAGLSVNAWLVRVAAHAAERDRSDPRDERPFGDGHQFRGWVR
jgi:hypothetical protein